MVTVVRIKITIVKQKHIITQHNKHKTMNKIIGIDMGTNSVGWALIDKDNNANIINSGALAFPHNSLDSRAQERQRRRYTRRLTTTADNKSTDKSIIINICLLIIVLITGILTLVNNPNWQYWLILSLSFLIALLTLTYSKNK